MLLYRAQGAVLAVLGVGSVLEAMHIAAEAREASNFDAIGPDRYLLGLGVLMLVIGARLAVWPPAEGYAALPDQPNTGATFFFTLGMVAALAAVLPYIGFPLASFTFLTIMFRRFGNWPWLLSAGVAAAVAAVFYVTFILVADVPLPRASLLP